MVRRLTGAALAAVIVLLMAAAVSGAEVPTRGQVGGAQIPTGGIAPVERVTKRVGSAGELEQVLRSDFSGRIIIPAGVNWNMVTPCGAKDEFGRCVDTPMRELPVKSGVQIVGERGPL